VLEQLLIFTASSTQVQTMATVQLSLKGRALRLLSTREHSRFELERKLTPFEEAPGDLAKALDELHQKGFINEQRVIESVVHRRSAKLGVSRIKQELQSKGLDREAVGEALAGLKDTEVARAREVWQRKFGEPAVDAKESAKQMRFLASRGFSGEAIRKAMTVSSDD
jgi:regulatory protein